MFTSKMLFAAAAVAASTAAVSPASAAPERVYLTTDVSYADLNLASQSGVATLKHRIKAAAREVCGWAPMGDLGGVTDVSRCRSAAIADASRVMVTVIASAERGERYASIDSGKIAVSGR